MRSTSAVSAIVSLLKVEGGQPRQRFVEREDVDIRHHPCELRIIERNFFIAGSPLVGCVTKMRAAVAGPVTVTSPSF